MVGVAAAVEEGAAEALVGAEQIVDAGAHGQAEHVLVLDEQAEAAGRVEEAEALVEPEAGRLAVLEEVAAIGPFVLGMSWRRLISIWRVMFSLIGRCSPVSGSVSRVRWNCRFMSILAPRQPSGSKLKVLVHCRP